MENQLPPKPTEPSTMTPPSGVPSTSSTSPHIETAHPVHTDPPSSQKSSMAPIIFAVVLAIFTGVLGFYLGRMTAPIPEQQPVPQAQENVPPTVFTGTDTPTPTLEQMQEQSSDSAQVTVPPTTQ